MRRYDIPDQCKIVGKSAFELLRAMTPVFAEYVEEYGPTPDMEGMKELGLIEAANRLLEAESDAEFFSRPNAAALAAPRRFCADCGATVFVQPDMMGCHCRNAPWHAQGDAQ